MGRKPEPSKRTPSFFKVMLGHFSQQLKIPPAFAKQYDGVLPKKFILRSPAGRIRSVNVKKVENNYFLEKGWRLFAQDNSLDFGDFLVFRYTRNSEFNVIIYGKNGCEKEAVVPTRKSSEVIYTDADCTSDETGTFSPQDQGESKEFKPLQGNFKQVMCGETVDSRQVTENSSCSRIPMAMQGEDGALEAANKFISKHPSFKVVISQSYLGAGGMFLPASFVKRYIKEGRLSATLQVLDRSWPVKLLCHTKSRCRFSAGSMAFVKDNNLGEGDVCVFELVKRNDILLKVSIFRCVGN